MTDRPLLFLDVDGPLNPWAAKPTRRPKGYTTHRMRPTGFEHGKPLRVWLNHSHGKELLDLGYDLIWATTWGSEANEWIGPHIGLPELPAVTWPEGHHTCPMTDRQGINWKTKALHAYAGHRPFAWVDDDLTNNDALWLHDHHPAPFLPHHVDPRLGLLESDFTALRDWTPSKEALST